MSFSIRYLQNCFKNALEDNAPYIGVAVRIPNITGVEVIINKTSNFEEKLKYYQEAYDEKLRLKANPKIEIVGFTYGNSFADIEEQLKPLL
jgi:hypothetical protein